MDADVALDALGDPTRRRIIEILREGPRPVGELAADLPVGRPAVSKHLRVLGEAGLVEHHSVGTRNLYALAPDGLAPVQEWLVAQWDGVLGAFAAHVAEHHAGERAPGSRRSAS
ncbi:ArsR/SmtB family transcription factor [Microbacterium rhizophilus]|uniref:ArsR/SmtB family transcription factor n=1 Tax=Microbacterium rhizophilus TaxID=3138934 RepID=UPI0031F00CC5